jgi:phage gp29-like protein
MTTTNAEIQAAPDSAVRAAAPPKPRPRVEVVNDLPTWSHAARIGGSLTPEQVSSIIREADTGRMARLIDLANEARQKDSHLQGILETRENAVAALAWDLVLPPKAKRKEKQAHALCNEVLKRLLPALVPHHNGSVYPGYAVSEQVWAKDGRFLVPAYTKPIAARRFVYQGSRLLWHDAGSSDAPRDLRDYPGQFIVSRPRVNGDVPCREGLVRPLMWAALFRNWTTADWLKLAEIAWKPWRTGSYDKDASQEDIDNLQAVLAAMTANGIAVYPASTSLKIEWPSSGGGQQTGTHQALFNAMAAEMSKTVLGQTLTTEQGNVGTQALGKVHDGVRKDKRTGDARFIERDVMRDMIAWVVLWNFGPGVRLPKLVFDTGDGVDFKAFGESLKSYRDAGMRVPAKWARATAGIPEPVKDEEILGETPAKADASEESDEDLEGAA